MKVRDVLEAMKRDTTPKSNTYFIDPNSNKTCAIGGAAQILRIDSHHLARGLGQIDVPFEAGDDTNLLSPNYEPDEDNLTPTLRKRIEYLSDHTKNSKKKVAKLIEKKYPDLLDVEIW